MTTKSTALETEIKANESKLSQLVVCVAGVFIGFYVIDAIGYMRYTHWTISTVKHAKKKHNRWRCDEN